MSELFRDLLLLKFYRLLREILNVTVRRGLNGTRGVEGSTVERYLASLNRNRLEGGRCL